METVNVSPDVAAIVRYLRALYLDSPGRARHILCAGWPMISIDDANAVLSGRLTLAEAIPKAKITAAELRRETAELSQEGDFTDPPTLEPMDAQYWKDRRNRLPQI